MTSCNPPKHTYRSDHNGSKAGVSSNILFLDYQLARDSTSSLYNAQLISMIIVEGSIKTIRQNAFQAEKNDLELLVLDKNQQVLTQLHIPNPLDKSVEYVNDAGQFERRLIHLDSTQFSIRLQVETEASSIMLKRFIGDNNEGILLLNTPVK